MKQIQLVCVLFCLLVNMRIRSRLLLISQQQEAVGCEKEIDIDDPTVDEGQLIPPTVPILPPVDLRALAA